MPCLLCLSLSRSVVLPVLVVLAALAEEHPSTRGCLLMTTTPQQPHLTTCVCVCYYPRDDDDALTPALMLAKRIYNIRSARLLLALSLPPASRRQCRVAAQYNTAAGRLHVA